MAVRKIKRYLRREGREVTKWVADYRLPDGTRPMPEFNTKREAEEEIARQKLLRSKKQEEHRKLIEQTAGRPVRSIEDLVRYHVDTVCAHWTEKGRTGLRGRLRPFVAWCLGRGLFYAHQLTKADAAAYRQYLLTEALTQYGKPISASTMEFWLMAASMVFESEIRHQEPPAITLNPFRNIKKSGYVRKELPVLVEKDQLRAFLTSCPEFEYHLFRLEYAGGFRAGELMNLTWLQVKSRQIELTPHDGWRAKTGGGGAASAGVIELNDIITESLAWFRLRSGKKKYVIDPETFLDVRGYRVGAIKVGPSFIGDRFTRVLKVAKRDYPGYDWSKFTPHKLRTAYGSHLAELGVPLVTVQRLMRHKNYKTTAEMYVRVSPKAITEAARTLDQLDMTPIGKVG